MFYIEIRQEIMPCWVFIPFTPLLHNKKCEDTYDIFCRVELSLGNKKHCHNHVYHIEIHVII